MQILLILLSSGSLGFISYLILRELSVLNFPLREKEIEKITLIYFSIFNSVAVYLLCWWIFDIDLLEVVLDITVFAKIIFLAVLSSLFMPLIYYIILLMSRTIFGKIQRERNLITTKYKPLFDDLFLPSKYEDTYIFVFDFSNEFIHAGHLERMEYKEGKLYFSLYATPYYKKYSYDDVIQMFYEDGRDPNELKIIIDTDRQQKYFLMYNLSDTSTDPSETT